MAIAAVWGEGIFLHSSHISFTGDHQHILFTQLMKLYRRKVDSLILGNNCRGLDPCAGKAGDEISDAIGS
jgi:hypothetical protein